MLPENNSIPDFTYRAKKLLCPLSMKMKRIHVCLNDCIFANSKDAHLLQWHMDDRKDDGMLRHPEDFSEWRNINRIFKDFGDEPRNLRLGLCTDGMNPYGE
jgi:Transposase family tnp2